MLETYIRGKKLLGKNHTEFVSYSCKDIIQVRKWPVKVAKKKIGEFHYSCKWDIKLCLQRYYSRYKIPRNSCKKVVRGSCTQTSIVISAKDLKLLGRVFHKIYFCQDIIRVI